MDNVWVIVSFICFVLGFVFMGIFIFLVLCGFYEGSGFWNIFLVRFGRGGGG